MVLLKLDPFVRWSLALGVCASLVVGCSDDDSSATDGTGTAGDSEDTGGSMTAATMSASGATMTAGTGSMTSDTGDSTAAGTADDTAGDTAGDTAEDTAGDDSGSSSGGGDDSGSSSGEGGDSGSSSDDDMMKTDDGPPELCEAPGNLITCDATASSPTIFNAIGLACTGGPDQVIPILGEGFNENDAGTWAIASQFGTFVDPVSGEAIWSPTEGDNFLVLSSGQVGTPNASGALPAQGGDNSGNPDGKPLPAPMTATSGSGAAPFVGCDGVGDCSDSLAGQWAAGGGAANDLIWFQFASQVPGGTHGFSIDFAYFSEEFPEWVGTTFNDMFVVWSNSETYTGNLCFVDDQPCTVTALWPTQYQNNAAELAGTGFGFDGGTGWFQIKGSAEPLELLQLSFAVFDMGDTILDTYVILDNFQWDCEGCTPTEVNPCGVVDPV
jgi:hypothetical protein